MTSRTFFSCLFSIISIACQAQLSAKAISYAVEIDLTKFNPEAAGSLADKTCVYEVDAYYTDKEVKTMVRNIKRPIEISLRQRQYEIATQDEYNIDHDNKFILVKKGQDFKPKSTGGKKTILGYACKEYSFKDYRGIQFSVWVTDKLPKNICPAGNFSLDGTALEVTASNGLHYLATDVAGGQLESDFFKMPSGYEQEVMPPPADVKKSK
jgi:hypothetical protein